MKYVNYGDAYGLFLKKYLINLRTPRCWKYFSERNGHEKPLIEIAGYRLFIMETK